MRTSTTKSSLKKSSWFKNILCLAVTLLLCGILVEILTSYLAGQRFFLVNEKPVRVQRNASFFAWRTENSPWGAWHKPHAQATHQDNCYVATYTSNEVGARDTSFTEDTNKKRYILLGDSFAEGYGVNDADRAQQHIEQRTGTRLYNLSASGDFGPVQYYIIYDKLGKQYPHDGLIIFFFPANDFTDNDYDFWQHTGMTYLSSHEGKERWRPYYKQEADGSYGYFFPQTALQRDSFLPNLEGFEGFVADNFWSYNIIRSMRLARKLSDMNAYYKNRYGIDRHFSGYFDASLAQQKAAIHFLDTIMAHTPAAHIIVVAIPRLIDAEVKAKGGKLDEQYWWQQLNTAKERLGKNIEFIDLINELPSNPKQLFLSCDGHWSPEGNRWAGEIVARTMMQQ